MNIDRATGLLDRARFVPSPNCDDRPGGGEAFDLILVHGISLPPGEFGGDWIQDLFTNRLDASRHPYFGELKGMKVSAHLLITRTGALTQFVPFHRRAWHAGRSEYAGRTQCNDFSIGIELEGTDDVPYEDIQYQRLAHVIEALLRTYPKLSQDSIAGHQHVSPGRKTDPGPAFDWTRLDRLLRGNGPDRGGSPVSGALPPSDRGH